MIRYNILGFLFLLSSGLLCGQQEFDQYLEKAWSYQLYQNDSAIYFADLAYEVADNKSLQSKALIAKGCMFTTNLGKPRMAIHFLDSIYQVNSAHIDRDDLVRLHEGLCVAYDALDDYPKMIEAAQQMIKNAAGDSNDQINAYNFLFDANYELGFEEKAIEYALKSFDLAAEAGNVFGLHQVSFRFFDYFKTRLSEEPFTTYLLKYFELTNYQILPADYIHASFQFLKDYSLSSDQLRALYNKARENNNAIGELRIGEKLANLLIQEHNVKEALNVLNDLEDLLDSQFKDYNYAITYHLKSKAHQKNKDFEKALIYTQKLNALDDSLSNLEIKKYADSLNVLFESTKKDQQIAQQEINLQKSTRQKYMLYVLLIGLVFFGGLLFYIFKKRRDYREALISKEQQIQLDKIQKLEQQQKIIALDYMLMGEENERKRIAKDLHDSIGALLTSARLQIQNIFKENQNLSKSAYSQTESIISEAAKEVRRISHDMMPDALVNLGLQAAIQDLIEKLKSGSGLDISGHYFDLDEPNISDQVKLGVYRIVQELTQNVMKHAYASHMIIQLSQEERQLNLEVEDNGIGFDAKHLEKQKGIGLKNIESRVKYLNGKMEIESKVGGPTIFHVSVPLKLRDTD